MVITCVATGGRPEASITWTMPETVLFSVEEEVQILVGFDKFNDKLKLKICTSNQEDDTFQTVSKLTFTPSQEEHEKKVSCQAINDVMEEAVEFETELNILCK